MNCFKKHAALSLLLMLVVTIQCAGQKVPSTITSSLHWADTRESRRAQAGEWLQEILTIDRQIPTLSPAEQAWLKEEYDDELSRNNGFSSVRANRARLSKEGSARFAKPITKNMLSILQKLSSTDALNLRDEVALWSRLAYTALDVNFWGDIANLGERGVLERDAKSVLGTDRFPTYQEALRGLWASRAEFILGDIVIPFLDSQRR